MSKNISEVFQFCPFCKNKLEHLNERLVDCKTCGFHYYWNASPTTGVLLENKNGEILLVKRKFDPKKGFWDVPGGFVNDDENFEEGLVREIKEELGIIVNNIEYICSATDLYPYKGLKYHTIVALFWGKIEEAVYPTDDVSEVKFFKKEEFRNVEFAFPGLATLIENYLSANKIKKGKKRNL